MSEEEAFSKKKNKKKSNVLTGVASFWSPSRGPTSTILTFDGRSAPRRRCWFVCG